MSNLVFSRPLGDDLSPFGFSRCCDASWIGPAITATDNLFNRVENHWMQNRQQHFESDEAEKAYNRQRELSNELLDKQYDYSKQLWEANNEYNTPAAQVQRMREAGLNPYVYSHGSDIGTGVSGSPATTPNIGAPSVAKASSPGYSVAPTHDVGALLMAGSSLKNEKMRSFAQLVEAYPKVLEACNGDTDKAENVMRQLSGISGLKGDLPFRLATSQYEMQEANKEMAQVEVGLKKKYGDKEASNILALQDQSFNKMAAEVNKMAAEARKMSSDVKVNEAKCKEIASVFVRNLADAYKLRMEGDKLKVDANTALLIQKSLVSLYTSQSGLLANQLIRDNVMLGAESADGGLFDYLGSEDGSADVKDMWTLNHDWWHQVFSEIGQMIPDVVVPVATRGFATGTPKPKPVKGFGR